MSTLLALILLAAPVLVPGSTPAVTATSALASAPAAADWGQIGHYTTAYVALAYMSPAAQQAVRDVLGGHSFVTATVYMDDVRSDDAYDSYADWHWVTIPDGQTYEQTEKNPDGDVIYGIETLTAELRAGGLSPELEREKLKFLIHLIGDLHMPLHVGTGEDLGGNRVQVSWFRESSNLHRVWDSNMIESRQLSASELASSLPSPAPDVIRDWQSTGPRQWALESMSHRDAVYNLPEDRRLGYEYRYENFHIVETRLLKAGVRIAGVLNELYGD